MGAFALFAPARVNKRSPPSNSHSEGSIHAFSSLVALVALVALMTLVQGLSRSWELDQLRGFFSPIPHLRASIVYPKKGVQTIQPVGKEAQTHSSISKGSKTVMIDILS